MISFMNERWHDPSAVKTYRPGIGLYDKFVTKL